MQTYLEQLDSSLFDFHTWESGSFLTLGFSTRFDDIIKNKQLIQKYAVGWAKGETLPCRPKTDCMGVMFEKDENRFWTHLTNDEFYEIFITERQIIFEVDLAQGKDKSAMTKFKYENDMLVNIEWREIEDAEFSKCTNNSSKISN